MSWGGEGSVLGRRGKCTGEEREVYWGGEGSDVGPLLIMEVARNI